VRFASTPVRRAAVGVTWFSLLGPCWSRLPGRAYGDRRWKRKIDAGGTSRPGREYGGLVPAAVALFTLLFAGLLNPQGWLHLESEDFVALPAEQQLFADFGEQIALIGYSSNKELCARATLCI
jgi:hypothetical protein